MNAMSEGTKVKAVISELVAAFPGPPQIVPLPQSAPLIDVTPERQPLTPPCLVQPCLLGTTLPAWYNLACLAQPCAML
jgi:hypothetical protein